MPAVKMRVKLLEHTDNHERLVAMAARLCYSPANLDKLEQRAEAADNTPFIGELINVGHLSMIEHVSFTFGIEGVSRSLLAQITRHRIASFAVQSQRYVAFKGEDFPYVLPPAIEALGPDAAARYDEQMRVIKSWYDEWLERLPDSERGREDARFVMPNAAATRMIVTMNARELLHFFSLRCCGRAQWELRALAWEMLALVKRVAPAIFEQAGPACLRGACPEGARSCGRADEARLRAAGDGVAAAPPVP